MYASRFVLGAIALSLLVAGFGCKTGKSGKVPTENRLGTFVAPEREEVFPDEAETDEEGSLEDADTEE